MASAEAWAIGAIVATSAHVALGTARIGSAAYGCFAFFFFENLSVHGLQICVVIRRFLGFDSGFFFVLVFFVFVFFADGFIFVAAVGRDFIAFVEVSAFAAVVASFAVFVFFFDTAVVDYILVAFFEACAFAAVVAAFAALGISIVVILAIIGVVGSFVVAGLEVLASFALSASVAVVAFSAVLAAVAVVVILAVLVAVARIAVLAIIVVAFGLFADFELGSDFRSRWS